MFEKLLEVLMPFPAQDRRLREMSLFNIFVWRLFLLLNVLQRAVPVVEADEITQDLRQLRAKVSADGRRQQTDDDLVQLEYPLLHGGAKITVHARSCVFL